MDLELKVQSKPLVILQPLVIEWRGFRGNRCFDRRLPMGFIAAQASKNRPFGPERGAASPNLPQDELAES